MCRHVVIVCTPYRGDRLISVDNAEDELHARLAAYYYFYGIEKMPDLKTLIELTSVWTVTGLADAKPFLNQIAPDPIKPGTG